MSLSKRSIVTLLDLVEIKLGCLETYDREDERELSFLESCRDELTALRQGGATTAQSTPPTRMKVA